MCTDIVASLINQNSMLQCFERIQKIDDVLAKENIKLDNRKLTRTIIIILFIICSFELFLTTTNFIQFQFNNNFISIWWFVTEIPIFLNAVSKGWFVILIYSVRYRLMAINDYLSKTKDIFNENKMKYKVQAMQSVNQRFNYLNTEIFSRNMTALTAVNTLKKKSNASAKGLELSRGISTISKKHMHKDVIHVQPFDITKEKNVITQENYFYLNEKEFVINDKMDKKLILLCRLHDEICEVGKLVNRMFSVQMLLTTAYSFLGVTAQFYFLYCGQVGQVN